MSWNVEFEEDSGNAAKFTYLISGEGCGCCDTSFYRNVNVQGEVYTNNISKEDLQNVIKDLNKSLSNAFGLRDLLKELPEPFKES
jgi:hypothetical protein